ncbi:hypothetical protein [Mesorhizobium sp. LjNodule214]|uniref:hypothetical protein n=1 Tax=Mesorhizobium sp. LjNodule214 TaxID=3342252 RepID=UPI003ECD2E29
MFFRGSRYEHIADASIAGPGERTIRYKRMRFIPAVTARLSMTVNEGDRPDLATWRAIGDPEQFWRLCDVNLVRRPVDLTAQAGRRLGVPGPEGGF